jgi:hypothetical protein
LQGAAVNSSDEILRILDRGAESFHFPMLDNGYVYLATSRLTLYRSDADWALAFEIFGYCPRGELPDLNVYTFASNLWNRDKPETYISRDRYENYLAHHPHDDSRFFYPIAKGWQDPEYWELVSEEADHVVLRDKRIKIPSAKDFDWFGVELQDFPRIRVFELCRFLAETEKPGVLGTPQERRVSVLPKMVEILTLDEWNHPDLANSELPSQSETFQQLAQVLATGDTSKYWPSKAPNSHWKNWPDGGTL